MPHGIIHIDPEIWAITYDIVRDHPDVPQRRRDMVLANAEVTG